MPGTECSETLDLGTPVQQVLHARELLRALDTLRVPQNEQTKLRLKHSSEDLPSSYRWVPILPKKLVLVMVALWVIGVGEKFKSYTPMSLG